ncbi:MAG TPA: aspartate ammonia-lyase [Kiritimatiellia bacterium]|nr:aspartate ammonia-lyase [Kiritimatiellia bacterium]HSA19560.1 aspartate ammonia-lyase [Kiritimatiellia bacterium]
MRVEKDSLGERQVPDEAYYGIHTARSLENFDIAGEPMPLEIVYGLVKIKWATATANAALGMIPADKADAIKAACLRVLKGEFDGEFKVDVFQAGSGTSSNMNVNEVLANIANEALGGRRGDRRPVHPHDDVNLGTSTNNTFPSAVKIALVEKASAMLLSLRRLVEELHGKEREFKDILKTGRTHLQDAVPITLGQEFGAWARALEKDVRRIESARLKLRELGVGGNAIGTGVNTRREFRPILIRALGTFTGEVYEGAENGIEITQFMTDLGEYSSALKLLALDVGKVCNDLRLLSSGPNTGLDEIILPPLEPGSSIMPGKFNPSACEAVNMACLQVFGLDAAVAAACGAGQLELNTYMPLIGFNLLRATRYLERACALLGEKCVRGIQANREECARHFEHSAGLATVLNPKLGYDRVAELVRESLETGRTLRQLVLEKKIMTEDQFNDVLKHSTGPNL